VNTPDAGLIGRFGVLTEPGNAGPRVRVGDSDWAARLPRDLAESPAGTRVRVEGVDGTTLVVRPE
jgi:membrane protein implicated in regulation of membrane protease activity